MPKCHNCKGKGIVCCGKSSIKGKCYYCMGHGVRIRKDSRYVGVVKLGKQKANK